MRNFSLYWYIISIGLYGGAIALLFAKGFTEFSVCYMLGAAAGKISEMEMVRK